MASLPWVDQKSFQADVATQEIKFVVPDMKRFDRTELLDAFKKHNFPNTKIVAPAT